MISGCVKPRARSLTYQHYVSLDRKRCCSSDSVSCKEKRLLKLDISKISRGDKFVVLQSTKQRAERKTVYNDFSSEGVSLSTNEKYRTNAFNIQMLNESLRRQIFGDGDISEKGNPQLIEKAKAKLKQHGLWKDKIEFLKDVSLDLPPLRGKNIEEHFWNIGEEQAKPYRNLISLFIKDGLPNPPSEWLCQKGWTKYVEGKEPVSVPFPEDDIFVFDVEVNVKLGQLPTLATAVSPNAWYGWVCSDLADKVESIPTNRYTTNRLIPFEGKINKERPRVIIGHNVCYDRARIREQYYMKNSALQFLDTMSLHICIGGIAKSQKTNLKKNASELESNVEKELCLCSLQELYKLYCNKELSKNPRDIFLKGSMTDVKENFQDLMNYCLGDVKATYEVLQAIFPAFLNRFPHPVTLAGMLEMGSPYLTVNNNWNKYLSEAEETYEDISSELLSILSKKCDNACKLYHNEEYKKDLWMWTEDWTTQELKLTKKKLKGTTPLIKTENTEVCQNERALEEEEELKEENELKSKFQYLFNLGQLLPKKLPFLPGYPLWYRKLCEKTDSANWTSSPQLSPSMYVTPKLLNLTWENFPLYHSQKYGWGILIPDVFAEDVNTSVPFQLLKELTVKNLNLENLNEVKNMIKKGVRNNKVPYYKGSAIWCNHVIDECCYFFKLPHKNISSKNVGNPLSNEYIHEFNNGILNTDDYDAAKVIDLKQKLTYWRNSRKRIIDQMVVWLNKKETSIVSGCDEDNSQGIILPLTVVCGTLTRRAMDPTWLTASRVTQNRIGSELRSMIQAPPGYHFVGADVDSQELWIASLIGDSFYAKEHGCTPFGWMTISGTKSSGTDMHSVIAKEVGISRDSAKIINYARIYGGGIVLAKKLLIHANPILSEGEALSKAKKMYTFAKGRKEFKVKKSFSHQSYGEQISFYDLGSAARFAKSLGKNIDEVFEKPQWVNGTESAVFNQLEKIASSQKPVTPFLQGRLTRALEPRFEGDNLLLNTRINWVVQSGAVDFLHLLLVCMKWLTNGKARYCFSFHDEVRYLVPTEDRYNAALALHACNLLVRAFCSYRLGIYDLPQSVAFFSTVEIDKSLRKDANDDCVTPSNPHGIEKEYGIAPGESLNIYETIQKSGGSLSQFWTGKKKASSSSSPKAEAYKTEMSQATKRKHVCREILKGELVPPKENQQIVKVLGSRGNNLHEVETPESTTFLVSMPSKFRKNIWIKRGDYVLVEPIEEGGKVKAEIINILTQDYIKYLKKENIWPEEFSQKSEDLPASDENDGLSENSNRKTVTSVSEDDSE